MPKAQKIAWIALAVFANHGSIALSFEPWADSKLSVQAGMMFWLDAGRQQAAWAAHGKANSPTGELDVCYDGSGSKRHFFQRQAAAQPKLILADERAVIRFDGKDDCLGLEQRGGRLKEFTAYIVASPRINGGNYSSFLAAHEAGRNDYVTGFNVDMAFMPTDRLSVLNVEGKGFGGAVNLLKTPLDFGEFRVFEISSRIGPNGLSLVVDGKEQNARNRAPETLALDGISIGARYYSNSAEAPRMTGFLDGDVAEVIFYDRALSNDERAAVRGYLEKKHAGLSQLMAARRKGRILTAVENAPAVQVLVPGFKVDELPLNLTNLTNLRYRHDGKLMALAYNGNVWLISDSDGDGNEDKADLFWENKGRLQGTIGIALTPPGYKHGDGLFVAATGKVMMIVDTNKDDRADREQVIATGWPPIAHSLDAVGVAMDKEGAVYFGIGTTNFANGYLLDQDGKAKFDITGERGTIIRVSPDLNSREIVCTGVRWPVALAFNRRGDLFCTDQEGATWLSNGNPFDELLHIEPKRHYGFPPSHPKHLPGVIDEPSVFDYGPQHQSTCGFFFNEPSEGKPHFGPAWWDGDAFVCGESRGKLFQTRLAKTLAGYIARTRTLACLGMLTVDACLSPDGDVVVACHSGPPDWGTGPEGKGKLFKIRYVDKAAPQPVTAWAAGPQQVRIAFDRPLDPASLRNLLARTKIEFGKYVRAGDRFETLRPPYAVVQRQAATPRFDLAVLSAQIASDGRTLVLTTDRHIEPVHYAVTIDGLPREKTAPGKREIEQHNAIDLDYDLCGIQAAWKAESGDESWDGWLPHLDLEVSKEMTRGSFEHDRLWALLKKKGTLTLKTQLDLWNMLRPEIQEGASIDYTPPGEVVHLEIKTIGDTKAKADGADSLRIRDGVVTTHKLELKPNRDTWTEFAMTLPTGSDVSCQIAYSTLEEKRLRTLHVRRFRLPWTSPKAESSDEEYKREIPELAGGDWLKGRKLFYSEETNCSKCHRLGGRGGRIGPELGNLPHRDYLSVRRDILEPSAAINPDHVSYTAVLADGRVLTGVSLGSDAESFLLGDAKGNEIRIDRKEIESLATSALSTMPADLNKALEGDKLRDLMTFLMTDPLGTSPLTRTDAPPPRRRAEIESLLSSASPATSTRPLHIALVACPKDHGPDEHDYPLWQTRWSKLLGLAESVTISQASNWPTSEQFERADVIVMYSSNPAWSPDKGRDLDRFLARGGGLVLIHWAVNGGGAADALAERIGLAGGPGGFRFRHGPLDLAVAGSQTEITHGIEKVHFVDESYWGMVGDPKRINVLASGVEDAQPRPLIWTRELPNEKEKPAGRVFVSIPGHYTWTFDDPIFRILVLRGMAWSAREPVDRFIDLATVGVRMRD